MKIFIHDHILMCFHFNSFRHIAQPHGPDNICGRLDMKLL